MYESQAVTLKQVIHFRGKKLIFRRNPSNKSFTLHSQVIVVTCGKSEWVKTTIDWFGVMTSHIGAIHASKRTLELSSRTSPLRWSDRGVGRALWRSSPSTFHRARDHTACDPTWCCAARAPMRSVQVVAGKTPADQAGRSPCARFGRLEADRFGLLRRVAAGVANCGQPGFMLPNCKSTWGRVLGFKGSSSKSKTVSNIISIGCIEIRQCGNTRNKRNHRHFVGGVLL